MRKCPFCQQDLKGHGVLYTHYVCNSIECMLRNDFPRYIATVDYKGNIVYQEYALGDYYVKVEEGRTRIYRLVICMLHDEINIPRALWLNPTNSQETLDKLKLMAILS